MCVACGIDIETCRAVLTRRPVDKETIDRVVRAVSLVVPVGMFPLASEASTGRRPWTVWGIAIVTVAASLLYFPVQNDTSGAMRVGKRLMLWAGEQTPSAGRLRRLYAAGWGDRAALRREARRIAAAKKGDRGGRTDGGPTTEPPFAGKTSGAGAGKADGRIPPQRLVRAHEALPPSKRATGRFEAHQLVTHALLHGGVMHLAGNLVFLLVLGAAVNACIGNVVTGAIYPLLAFAAAGAQMLAAADEARTPMLGASGAIMGLAGMHMVLFPAHYAVMAFWIRPLAVFTPPLKLVGHVRAFWVVLLYLVLNVADLVFDMAGGVAVWAHLGGLAAGFVLALLLVSTRLCAARGADLISLALGRRAWPLIGTPAEHQRGRLSSLP